MRRLRYSLSPLDPKVVQKLLGHKTLDRCGHLHPNDLDAAASAFDAAAATTADWLRTGETIGPANL